LDSLVSVHCSAVLGNIPNPYTARTTKLKASALSLKEALDAELLRGGTTVTIQWTGHSPSHQRAPSPRIIWVVGQPFLDA
jgi:hypothetical protein